MSETLKPDEYAVRLAMLSQMEKEGVYPYADHFEQTHHAADIISLVEKNAPRSADDVFASPKKEYALAGRIIAMREHGKIAFVNLQDKSGEIQICLKAEVLGTLYDFALKYWNLGDYIGICGEAFFTKQNKLAILATEAKILSKALRPLPEKFHGLEDLEARYRARYLDLASDRETFERFIHRSNLIQNIRTYLLKKDFLEVNTRILQPSAGGAVAKPFVTHHNALDEDFNLRIAPELDLKMTVAGGFERVFEFAVSFRNEGMDPSHLQEFLMLEWYAAYQNYETGMKWSEEMLRSVLETVFKKTTFTICDKNDKEHEIDISKPWPRNSFAKLMADAGVDIFADKETLLEHAKKIGLRAEDIKERSRANILDEIFKKTVRPTLIEPQFIIDYPADLMPLARRSDKDPRIAEVYQLLVAGWEVIKGYSELVDPVVQRKTLEDQAKAKKEGDEEAMDVNEEFLKAMEHGMPPMTGFGMGIDRLVALFTGQKNLRDVVLFPLMKPE